MNDQELGTSSSTRFSESKALFDRETQVKRRLELNGYRYPRCVEDVVELYVEVGLAKKSIEQTSGVIYYDLVIRPLNHVDSILKLKLGGSDRVGKRT
ncbi:hypothetical protein D3C74_423760 [compost metagenome]